MGVEKAMRNKRDGVLLLMAQRRSELLKKWINDHTTQAELARQVGCTRQYISWLIRNPFGYDAARGIESKFRIPEGTLEPLKF